MRRAVTCCLMMAILWAKGPMWVKLRYLGGTVQAKVSPYDWNTSLTVGTDSIELIFAPRQSLRLKPSQVISLSYGQEAHRRVADAVTLSAVLSPLALFGLLHVSKDHIIGIVYQTGDGKRGAMLLQCDKRDYWTILQTLKEVTGLPVESKP